MKQYWRFGLWIGYTALFGWVRFRDPWMSWVLGMGLASAIALFDRLFYALWLKPFEQLSLQIQYWIKQHDAVAVWRLINERGGEQTKLGLHSAGFALLWPLLVIYVLTSTGSVVAVGMVMGLGLHLASAIAADWNNPQQLANWFFWQIKRQMGKREMRLVTGGYIVVWVVFSLILLAK